MSKLVLIDGNSILNRAFYGIMGSKMLTTKDGKYTNAVYGFLAILFKVLDDIKPDYIAVSFDLKAPTARHKMYEGYKANRKGMPNELAEQMPIVKEILTEMNITIIEKETYEADDILGTLSKTAEKKGIDVVIVSGDRDTFQLASNKVTIRIPHTKVGKTEVDYFDEEAIVEKYGIKPKQLIEVKGLMGDTSDNIPGVSGIGEKTALELIKKYKTIDGLYKAIDEKKDDLKPKTKEKLVNDKEMAYLSKTLGTINREVPLDNKIEDLKIKEWNKEKVTEKFKELNFNRFMERFNLKEKSTESEGIDLSKDLFSTKNIAVSNKYIEDVIKKIKESKKLIFSILKEKCEDTEKIISKKITCISIYIEAENTVFSVSVNNEQQFVQVFKEIFESKDIQKYGHDLGEDYVILKQLGITMNAICYDTKISAYDLNPTDSKYTIENKRYKEGEIIKFKNYDLQIVESYITKLDYKGLSLFKDTNNYLIVKFNIINNTDNEITFNLDNLRVETKNAKNYDIIHCHLLNNGAFFLHYAKKYGIQCRILHSHVTKSADTKLKKLRNDLLVPIAIRNATHYFACSEDAGRFIFKNKNFTVINNAIDGDKFLYNEEKRNEIRHEMGLDNQFVFGNIGRLCPQKNQLFLLDIFYYIKNKKQNSKLIMIGNGPWKEKIEEKIKKLDLESDVIMLDSMENIQDMYQVFDMFLFPSNYEGLGIVLIEAQTSGLRCFTSNMVPIEAKITDNFRTQDIKNHAEKWADSVLEYSEEPYVRASRKDELITHNYDIKSEVKKLEDIYTIFAKEIKMK